MCIRDSDLEDDADFPSEFPLSHKQLLYKQQRDDVLQKRLMKKDSSCDKKIFRHSDKQYELIVKNDLIVIPLSLEKTATEWCHTHLLHPGETRLELTMRQHFTFIGPRPRAVKTCKACNVCRSLK